MPVLSCTENFGCSKQCVHSIGFISLFFYKALKIPVRFVVMPYAGSDYGTTVSIEIIFTFLLILEKYEFEGKCFMFELLFHTE